MNFAYARVTAGVAPHANPLRINRAQKAIAAVMSGESPDAGDSAALDNLRIDEQTLHLSTATALRRILMSRPAGSSRRAATRAGTDQPVVLNAYYLALALAGSTGSDNTELREALRGMGQAWFESAALIGSLQVRFLEHICTQVDLVANHLPVPSRLSTISARAALQRGGRIAPGTVLLDDHTFDSAKTSSRAESAWLHATSTVVVSGRPGPVVTDAGPDTISAAWAAAIAAPVTVIPAAGHWPVEAVDDCLRMCASGVRWWVASMTRMLSGEENEDLLLRAGDPLRTFLTSPASAAIAAAIAETKSGLPNVVRHSSLPHCGGDVSVSQARANVPLLAVREDNPRPRSRLAGTLVEMRNGGKPGTLLPADTVLSDCTYVAEIHRDEMALLSAIPATELDTEVDVTVNFVTPEWQDLTALISEVRSAGTVELSEPVLGWTDQDPLNSDGHRLTLRARVGAGVKLRTLDGYAVLLPAGTRFQLIGADTCKNHTTLYGVPDNGEETTSASGEQPQIDAA